MATNFIEAMKSWDWFPNFSAIIRVSHGALLSRCGQGRALLQAAFPARFYSKIHTFPQAIITY